MGQLATGSEASQSPMAMVNVSPATTALAVIVPEPPKFPAVDADHMPMWV